ncbi:S9 family peptidase [Pseudemcibacter aquimaris]|uniref:S9 family peptidase n=1 Tax=Pseudemcibacter aquimaris TaxID=2857064 RepID=UPI002011CD14|nr:DPP IV N-terminal domain-containing protein [Pseudemcibacter aquimaris]MCC3861187.1 S9 family peptidase [Pseudemcibacter aquimaris]WDU57962.1 S9 family peptidase [Pseudemcibacter aquimaris]
MKKFLIVSLMTCMVPSVGFSKVSSADYERAESFLPWNMRELVTNVDPDISWLENGDGLWLREQTPNGIRYKFHTENDAEIAFDHGRIAASLNALDEKQFDENNLDFDNLNIIGNNEQFSFTTSRGNHYSQYSCSLTEYSCSVSHIDGVLSPDGKWSATVEEDRNIYLINVSTGEKHQMTHGADKKNIIYGTRMPAVNLMIAAGQEDVLRRPNIYWAPDSSKFLSYKLDMSKAKTLTLVQAVHEDGIRPKTFNYPYSLPEDNELTMMEHIIFHVDGLKAVPTDASPIPIRYESVGPEYTWSNDSKLLRYIEYNRGNSEGWLKEVDAATGKTRLITTKTAGEGFVYPHSTRYQFINNDAEFIFTSERDGWNHFYMHDGKTGDVKHQITKGEFFVQEIMGVDEENGHLYFTANGREAHRETDGDPYLRYLYRINLDGSDIQLITKERGDHEVSMSPKLDMVVDKYSRHDLPTETMLKSIDDGGSNKLLTKADISELTAKGWKFPKTFKAFAEDGKTPIYGMMFYPTHFDPNKKYPIIENIYTGPALHNVKKNFRQTYQDTAQSIAELGFIVFLVDSRGTGYRRTDFHFGARGNLGGFYGDRVAAVKQLAEKYPYIDGEKVGIFGMSAGGYASARAMFLYPDFYTAAVSSSGNHDHRLDKANWNERWMGLPVGEQYVQSSNLEIAHRLTDGKLLLAVGELDHNVPPAATMQLLDRLIKANKDFDLIMMPNKQHSLEDDFYFIRKRWDYFVEHLLGEAPPEYRVRYYE